MELEAIRISGLLELYAIGDLNSAQEGYVERALTTFPELREDLREIEFLLEELSLVGAMTPNPTIKPMILALADYQERIQKGEEPIMPPLLTHHTKFSDFEFWLNRADFQEPAEYEDIHAKILGAAHDRTTLVVWLTEGAPDEVHNEQLESFFILEGTCRISVEGIAHELKAGDYFTVPLYANHSVLVTSATRCKIILERKAA